MKHITRAVVLLLVLVGCNIVVFAAVPQIQTWVALRRLGSSNRATFKRGLIYVRDERLAAAAPHLAGYLERETDPEMVELLGYSLMRTRALSGVPPLQERAQREGDSLLAARLILFTARLADCDYRLLNWLEDGARSALPCRQAGSMLGLIHLGREAGGSLLLEHRSEFPPEVQDFALQEFRGFVNIMSQAVGRPIPWTQRPEEDWMAAGGFWRRYATRDLLRDALLRMQRSDADWREVDRLIHARDRVSRWIR